MRVAAYHGEDVPTADGRDAEGNPTVKASEVKTLGPLAGYKGFGLGLCVALVSAPLMGAAVGPGTLGLVRCRWRSHPEGALLSRHRPRGAFGDVAVFRDAVSAYIAEVKATPPGLRRRRAARPGRARIPGSARGTSRGARSRCSTRRGERIEKIAGELGVRMPD